MNFQRLANALVHHSRTNRIIGRHQFVLLRLRQVAGPNDNVATQPIPRFDLSAT